MVSENKRRSNEVFLSLNTKLMQTELHSYVHTELLPVIQLLEQIHSKMLVVNPAVYQSRVSNKLHSTNEREDRFFF